MPYSGTTPEQDKKIESCVSKISGVNNRTNKPYTESEKIAICKSQVMETKSFLFASLELKSEDEENFYLEGYASSSNEDLGNDTVTEECLTEMASRINSGNVKLGFDHTELLGGRPTLEAVGRLIEAKVENGKLWVKGLLDKTFKHFNEIVHKIKNKFLDGFSIEYQIDPTKTTLDFKDGIQHRVIGGLRSLVGVALTPRPMNTDALFDYYVKHLEGEIETKEAFSKDKPGEGGRFEACVRKMEARGAKDPKALCAHIGRQKFGKAKMAKMATQGKSDEIPDEFYEVSDDEATIYINEFKMEHENHDSMTKCPECGKEMPEDKLEEHKKEHKGEKMEEKNTQETELIELKRLADIGKQVEESKVKEAKLAEFKALALEAVKAEIKSIKDKEPYLNPATKFVDAERTPFEAELKNFRNTLQDQNASLFSKYEAAGKLHDALSPYGINERGSMSSGSRNWKKNNIVIGSGLTSNNFQMKSFEYKAQLEHDTNKVSDADYYQNAAELNDVYDAVILDHLNQKTTYYGLVRKKDVSNIGSDRYGFRIRTGRIAGAGGDTSTYNYDEGATLTGQNSTKIKVQAPFMQYGAVVQVSGLTEAESRGSIGSAFTKEVQLATADLLKGMNVDLLGTAVGFTDGGKVTGLQVFGDDGSSYANLYGHARGTYVTLKGNLRAQTGSPNIDKILLRQILRDCEIDGADRNQLAIVCHPIQRDKILGMLDSAQRFNNTSARAGFEGLPTYDGTPIYADVDATDTVISIVPMDKTYLAILQAPTFEDLAKTDDSKKGFIKTYFAHVMEQPNHGGIITGLSNT